MDILRSYAYILAPTHYLFELYFTLAITMFRKLLRLPCTPMSQQKRPVFLLQNPLVNDMHGTSPNRTNPPYLLGPRKIRNRLSNILRYI